MGFLIPAEAVVARAIASAMRPPPPPDITRWCADNIVFNERSPFPGPFSIENFSFLREMHDVLSPEHPAREVTIKGSAQIGKTVSIVNATLGAWFEYGPLDALVVHPTMKGAVDWVRTKWLPMRREAPSLRRIFGIGRGDQTDTMQDQETLARDGTLKVATAGSPGDLTGTTRRLVIMDDVAKYEQTDKGDPESLAESRAAAFEDAKIVRISTPLVKGTCRISRAFARSDQRFYHVPCPHCGVFAPLTWENFKATIDPERLHAAHFTCESCGAAIYHGHKEAMVRAGRWVPRNPAGDHPGFFVWRAYVPQRDWASIAVEYARLMGWSTLTVGEARDADAEPEAETEQTFFNDVLGLEYEQASGGQDWTALRDRVEKAEEGAYVPRGRVPARGVLLTGGVDCQGDRTEVQVVAWGRDRRSWVVDHAVIPHHIGDEPARDALDAYMKATWRTTAGLELRLDALAIDSGAYTDDVWTWVTRYPRHRVIAIKGARSQTGPVMMPMQERRRDGKPNRARTKQGFMLNVSQMKADFYARLEREDPEARGFVSFAVGLGDEFFRQITAEVRVLRRDRNGVMTSQWELVEPTRRNEALDCHLYAEAAARRAGWASMVDAQWDALDAERGAAPPMAQPELFDIPIAQSAKGVPEASERRSRVRTMP